MRALPALRPERKKSARHVSCVPEAPAHAVLALQRAAGNRAVAGILARDPLGLDLLVPPSSDTQAGRKRLVPTLSATEVATAWLQLRDGSGLDLPGGSFLIDDAERAELLPLL